MRALPVLLASLLLTAAARADEAADVEALAQTDAAIALCSQALPQDAARFERLREPPYACAPRDLRAEQRLRALPAYRATYEHLLREVVAPLTREQVLAFCAAQLDARCEP